MRQNIKAYNNDSSSNEFAALLQQDLDKRVTKESSLVDAIVTKIEDKIVLCDIGLKSEATINKSELTSEEIETLKDEFIATAEKIEAETNYSPKANPLCDWCDFQDKCPLQKNKLDQLNRTYEVRSKRLGEDNINDLVSK